MSVDRRSHPRFKISVPLEIYREGGEIPARCATSDLSLSGCYIETVFPDRIGTCLHLKLQLEDTLLIQATVVTSDPQVGNGIRFEKMLPDDLEQLRAFLDSVAAHHAMTRSSAT